MFLRCHKLWGTMYHKLRCANARSLFTLTTYTHMTSISNTSCLASSCTVYALQQHSFLTRQILNLNSCAFSYKWLWIYEFPHGTCSRWNAFSGAGHGKRCPRWGVQAWNFCPGFPHSYLSRFFLILTNPGHFVGTKLSNGSILPKLSHWPSQSAWLASQNSLRQNYIKADGLLTTYTHTKFVCDCVHWWVKQALTGELRGPHTWPYVLYVVLLYVIYQSGHIINSYI